MLVRNDMIKTVVTRSYSVLKYICAVLGTITKQRKTIAYTQTIYNLQVHLTVLVSVLKDFFLNILNRVPHYLIFVVAHFARGGGGGGGYSDVVWTGVLG